MDEFLFRSSQKLDSLQIQLGIAASHSKEVCYQYSEQSKLLLSQVWNSSKSIQCREAFQELCFYLIDIAEHARYKFQYYGNPHRIYLAVVGLFGKNWTKREMCFGLAGIFIGGIIGIAVGLSYHKQKPMIRYMQAIQCQQYSGTESILVVEDAIAPYECADDEVLVDVKACSVQTLDGEICNGYGRTLRRILRKFYQNSSDLPVSLGRDCTGIVTDIGKNVERIDIGDQVWFAVPFWAQGTMSQTVAVAESRVGRKPRNVGFEGACSIPYAGCVALDALERCGINFENAQENRVFILGGSTPVSCVLIQILKHWGAEVSSCCNEYAVPVVRALGAEHIIVLDEEFDGSNFNSIKNYILDELQTREKYDALIVTWNACGGIEELQKYCGNLIFTTPIRLPSDSYGFIRECLLKGYIWLKLHLERIIGTSLNDYDEVHMCHSTLDKLTALVKNGHLQTVVEVVHPPQDIELALSHIQSTKSIGSTIISFR